VFFVNPLLKVWTKVYYNNALWKFDIKATNAQLYISAFGKVLLKLLLYNSAFDITAIVKEINKLKTVIGGYRTLDLLVVNNNNKNKIGYYLRASHFTHPSRHQSRPRSSNHSPLNSNQNQSSSSNSTACKPFPANIELRTETLESKSIVFSLQTKGIEVKEIVHCIRNSKRRFPERFIFPLTLFIWNRFPLIVPLLTIVSQRGWIPSHTVVNPNI
jgi:hypothetical protein